MLSFSSCLNSEKVHVVVFILLSLPSSPNFIHWFGIGINLLSPFIGSVQQCSRGWRQLLTQWFHRQTDQRPLPEDTTCEFWIR